MQYWNLPKSNINVTYGKTASTLASISENPNSNAWNIDRTFYEKGKKTLFQKFWDNLKSFIVLFIFYKLYDVWKCKMNNFPKDSLFLIHLTRVTPLLLNLATFKRFCMSSTLNEITVWEAYLFLIYWNGRQIYKKLNSKLR